MPCTDDDATLEIDHLEGDLVVALHHAGLGIARVQAGNVAAQPEVASGLGGRQSDSALVGLALALELALLIDHRGALPGDENHTALARAVEADPQPVGDEVAIDALRALVREVLAIDDDLRRHRAVGERRVREHVPHHLVGHAEDVLTLDAHAGHRTAAVWIELDSR
jgi:hypothetical protein